MSAILKKKGEKLIASSKLARDVISREADFMFTYFNMDDNQSSSQNTNEWQEIQPYMFEPNKNECSHNSYDSDDESTSTEEEEEGIDHEFEAINSWRLLTLEWCKCGHCAIMEKSIESFCCHEKAVRPSSFLQTDYPKNVWLLVAMSGGSLTLCGWPL